MGLLVPGTPGYDRFVQSMKNEQSDKRIQALEKEVLNLNEELDNTRKYVKEIEDKLDQVLYNTNR